VKITVQAYAKLNLHLSVAAPRSDGYHPVSSLMRSISLHDTLEIEIHPEGHLTRSPDLDTGPPSEHHSTARIKHASRIVFPQATVDWTCFPEDPAPPGENLVLRAIQTFLESLGSESARHPGLCSGRGWGPVTYKMALHKQIPAGAGLGGGSADAAAALAGLAHLHGMQLDDVTQLAAPLGADVPFSLSGGTALVTGIGETVSPQIDPHDFHALLVVPSVPIATHWAYRALDRTGNLLPVNENLSAIWDVYSTQGPTSLGQFARNSFESVVYSRFPVLLRIREALIEAGARWALLSGSGSTVFGVFDEAQSLLRARESFRSPDETCRLIPVTGVSRGITVHSHSQGPPMEVSR